MAKSVAEALGILPAIQRGMLNPVNLNNGSTPYFSNSDTSLTIAQKLNEATKLDSYGILTAFVVEVESIPQESSNFSELLNQQPEKEAEKITTQRAYVYIDVFHASHGYILDTTNFKNYLTEVEILGDMKLAIGDYVQVSLRSQSDYSKADFIKKLESSNLSAQLPATIVQGAALCGVPKVSPKRASPSSQPNFFANNNVGYVQAVYALAKWQIDNPQIQINSIRFPFSNSPSQPASSKIAKDISTLLSEATKVNQDALNRLPANANTEKQWVTLTSQMLANAQFESSQDSRILVRVNSAAPLEPALSVLNNLSVKYNAVKNDNESFFFSFPKNKTVSTDEAVALTEKNLGSFLNGIEQKGFGLPQQNNAPAPPTTTRQTNDCIDTPNFTGFSGDLSGEGIPFVDVGFGDGGKRARTHLIVMHHSVTSTAAGTVRVLRGKNCSVHVNIDRGSNAGAIQQHLPLDTRGSHAGRLNPYSIGVENTNPTGGTLSNNKPYKADPPEVYEGCYKALLAITKKTGIPFRIHEANVKPGYFYFGKLTGNQHLKPGIMAHGSDLGTTHADGKFELLYCQLRHLGKTKNQAHKRAIEMMLEARKNKKFHAPVTWGITDKNTGSTKVSGFQFAFVEI